MSELPDLQKSSDVSDEGGYGNKSTQAPKHLSKQKPTHLKAVKGPWFNQIDRSAKEVLYL